MKKPGLLLICFAIIAFSSCTRLREFPVQGTFEGIETALNRQSTTSLLIVHGMGGFSEGDPDTLVKTVEIQLNLQKCAPECIREIIDEETGKFYGVLKRQEYCRCCYPHNLRIYTLDWSQATSEEKERLQYFDSHCTADRHRLPFVREMKGQNINNSFADTILYVSGYKQEIQYPFVQAIRWIQEDAFDDVRHENVIVGFSLGGVICIDALDAMQDSNNQQLHDDSSEEIAKRFIRDTSGFFMVSNTYPLFELADTHPFVVHKYDDSKNCNDIDLCQQTEPNEEFACDKLAWDWEKSTIGRFVHEKRKSAPCFQIVAINDPNDFLGYNSIGYPVPIRNGGYLNAFLNEDVRNSTVAIFGFINPKDAHTKYGRNAKVLGMIIYGCQPCCDN
ncbi:MAG: hypothetical protein AAGG81_09035 [Chlamydiota bacterium]